MSAYFRAFEYSTKYNSTKVNIYFETGDHYILKSHYDKFVDLKSKNKDTDFTNPSFTIKM